jgi:Na+/melibiose symporter-like transporter
VTAPALAAFAGRAPGTRLDATALVAYGSFGMPLAMAALPVYVYLPQYYGGELGVDLTALGALLLALRLADGAIDPLIGAWSDRLRSRRVAILAAAPVLAIAMVALFLPLPRAQAPLLLWLGAALAAMYFAYSVAMINHNAWGAELSADPVERTRITATREGLALAGVVIASVAPTLLGDAGAPASGLGAYALCFALVTLLCARALTRAPAPPLAGAPAGSVWSELRVPLADPLFRRLLVVFLANGIASAIPATLVLFFIADVLGAQAQQGAFLALDFAAGALAMPLWVRLSARIGKVRAWALGMAGAILAFIWAWGLGPGDTTAFAIVCALSGIALGADLALPPSLLADVIGRGGETRGAGAYFGVWTLATKLNLALAAGIALPLLAALGYAPGAHDARALSALALVYAAVPCVLKLCAIGALYRFHRAGGTLGDRSAC